MTKITIDRATVEQALEAIEDLRGYRKDIDEAIVALRAALAQQAEPVQEPAGWFEGPFGKFRANQLFKHSWPAQTVAWSIPLHLAPPQRKPLTEEKPWRCACGANLYIDENGAPRSKA